MKKTIALICFAAFLFSCQKEVSDENGPNARLTGSLLTKRVDLYYSGDSAVTNYQYDANDRLIIEDAVYKAINAGTQVVKHFYARYTRDSHGRIITIAQKGPFSDTGNNEDTIFITVTYIDATSNKVAYLGNNYTSFTYDANNHVVKTTSASGYTEWSYDGSGNITTVKHYESGGNGGFTFNIGYDFEYDNKINPQLTGDDALIELRMCLTSSPNNVARQVNHYGGNANIPDDEIVSVYEYLNDGRPEVGGSITAGIPGAIVTRHYFYE